MNPECPSGWEQCHCTPSKEVRIARLQEHIELLEEQLQAAQDELDRVKQE